MKSVVGSFVPVIVRTSLRLKGLEGCARLELIERCNDLMGIFSLFDVIAKRQPEHLAWLEDEVGDDYQVFEAAYRNYLEMEVGRMLEGHTYARGLSPQEWLKGCNEWFSVQYRDTPYLGVVTRALRKPSEN